MSRTRVAITGVVDGAASLEHGARFHSAAQPGAPAQRAAVDVSCIALVA